MKWGDVAYQGALKNEQIQILGEPVNLPPSPPNKSPWRTERQFMAAIIAHCDALAATNPLYARVYHVSNENSHRQPGVRAGVPDLALDAARYDPDNGRHYHGWRCELKIGRNTVSPAQSDWLCYLAGEGYYTLTVTDDLAAVLADLSWYISLPVYS